ncbi:MAG TPA: site-specific integrase, partial [Patescibacteria group bacterium]|nr:site-specific integrase [Patescibacteria group bacterium]
MDLLELFKKSLLDKKASGSTVKNYLADIRKFLRWFEASFGREFLPSDLNRDTITLFEQTQGGSISLEEGDLAAQESETSARSFERYLSTLRKFASFLKSQNLIASNPFDEIKAVSAQIEAESDPWKVKEFKNYLYLGGASKVTIKNYMVDINAFCAWASHVLSVENLSDNVFSGIDQSLISSYKERLASVLHLSPTSINRKLSSIRKYLAFASEKGLIDSKKLQVSSYEDIKIVESISSGSLSLQDFKEEEEKSQPEVSKTQWSKIPPVRLLQKLLLPYALLEELIAAKLAFIIRGKRLAQKASQTTAPLAISSRKHSVRATTSPVLGITPPNLPKEMYAPHKISLTNLPFHKKLIHHARFTRPNWYKKYHSTSFSHYFHFAILIIYASVVGIIIYTNLFQDASSKKALAAPASPPRILSFQGRLTDNNDNPITTGTQIRFQIYSDPTATGAGNLLWQEVDYVSPDQDGIFSQLLGNGSTCSGQPLTPQSTPCAIPSSVFTDNSSLYLGITIESTPELTPRQRLATVAFAENSESLQGMLPITDVSAGQTNVVLALDTGGDLTIGGSASPTFAATGGQFELSGQTLLLSTTPGSNGNVNVVPDGLGKID